MKRFLTTTAETFSLLATPIAVLQSMQTTQKRMLRLMMSLKSSECPDSPCTDLTVNYLHIANTSVQFHSVHVPCRDDIQDEDFEAGGNAQQSYSMLHAFLHVQPSQSTTYLNLVISMIICKLRVFQHNRHCSTENSSRQLVHCNVLCLPARPLQLCILSALSSCCCHTARFTK